ncbi:NUDIX domain-containing protein [Lutibacter sp. A80]|uniref:NUDIX hydrolase n=1 Tax=Lutibacter sp. A80 TaxID=2918453 RepID=UPI001F0614F2|nr:NUDIX domain-containing protein [Lutibacter sp. A80]UMB60476.1 NUDIX domain-containing protein [Lutibacter sp. A80]
MYKVFVNDCPIILTENNKISTKYKTVSFNPLEIKAIVTDLFENKILGICLICKDLKADWQLFKSVFKIERAAGGKVINLNNEVLFIYRLNKWDLPKGKLEKGESIQNCAIREVEEECGITGLTISKFLGKTYHIFEKKEKMILKITSWFLMDTNFKDELTPQKEEDIEQAIFKNTEEINTALENTYENIKLLFK